MMTTTHHTTRTQDPQAHQRHLDEKHRNENRRGMCQKITGGIVCVISYVSSMVFQNNTGISCLRETVEIVTNKNGQTVAHISTNHLSCGFTSVVIPSLVMGVVTFKIAHLVIKRCGWWNPPAPPTR